MLAICELDVFYGDTQILRNVSLTAAPGKVTCILGRNGMGKSTLLKAIMGLLPAQGGTISFNRQNIKHLPPYERSRCGIAYVPQGRDIFPHLTVKENLELGFANGQAIDQGEITEMLTLFPKLGKLLNRKGGLLSGGEQQQLAIARALLQKPRLLLLDEPTEGIQPSVILEIEAVINKLKSRPDLGIILVEQYLDFAVELADYFYLFEKGCIVKQGAAAKLQNSDILTYLAI